MGGHEDLPKTEEIVDLRSALKGLKTLGQLDAAIKHSVGLTVPDLGHYPAATLLLMVKEAFNKIHANPDGWERVVEYYLPEDQEFREVFRRIVKDALKIGDSKK